jgi:tetratricopeptide (TPR) repeat protein
MTSDKPETHRSGAKVVRKKKVRKRTGWLRRPGGRVVLVVIFLLLVAAGGFLILRPGSGDRLNGLLNSASSAMSRREYSLAAKLLTEYLAEDPDSPRALFLLGAATFGRGEEEEGIRYVREALARKSDLGGARLFLGKYYARENRYAEALEQLESSREIEGSLVKARVLQTLGRLEEASADYTRAIGAGVRDFKVLFASLSLHQLLQRTGYPRAVVHRERGQNLLGLILNQARVRLEEEPSDPVALLALAKALDEQALAGVKRIDEAWAEALAADPMDADCRRGYAMFLARVGKEDRARALLKAGAEEHRSPGTYLLLADYLASKGEVDDSLETIAAAVGIWPDDPALLAAQTAANGAAGRSEAAAELAGKALGIFPGHPRVLEVAGDLARAEEDRETADSLYARALEVEPRNLQLLRKRVDLYFADLAVAQAREGDLPEVLVRTEKLLREILELNRWDRRGLYWQATLARARGRMGLALDLLADLLKYHPDERRARTMRGQILLDRQEYGLAVAELMAVIDSPAATLEDYVIFVRAALPFGRYERLVQVGERGLQKWPANLDLLTYVGEAELRLERGREFLERYLALPEKLREYPDLERLAGWAEAQAGRVEEAERRFRRLLLEEKISPGEFARFLYKIERGGEAGEFLRKAMEDDPASVESRLRMARFLLRDGDRDGARQMYVKATQADPQNLKAFLGLCEVLLGDERSRESDQAVKALIETIEALPNGTREALYLEGRRYLRNGDPKEAAERLGRFVRLVPDRYAGHLHLATCLALLGRRDEAVRELKAAVDLNPDSSEARIRLATLLFQDAATKMDGGNQEEARRVYEEVLALQGEHQPTRMLLATAFLRMGLPGLTEEQCLEALRENPRDGVAHLILAMTYARTGRSEKVLPELDIVVQEAPDHPVVRMFRALARIDAGDAMGALLDLEEAERLGLEAREIFYARARALLLEGDAAGALALAREATVREPESTLSWRLLGEIQLVRGETEEAATALERAWHFFRSDLYALAAAITIRAGRGEFEEAERLLKMVAEPVGPLLRARGDLELARGRIAKAEEYYLLAADEDPRARVHLAKIARDRGDVAVAKREYVAAIEAGIRDPAVRYAFGTLLMEEGDFEGARKEFAAVLRTIPGHLGALNNLALAQCESGGNLEQAVKAARAARTLAPKNPYVADTLGFALTLAGRPAEGLPLLREAIAALEKQASVQYHLGLALAATGEAAEARAHLTRALKDAPAAPWAGKAAEVLESLRD